MFIKWLSACSVEIMTENVHQITKQKSHGYIIICKYSLLWFQKANLKNWFVLQNNFLALSQSFLWCFVDKYLDICNYFYTGVTWSSVRLFKAHCVQDVVCRTVILSEKADCGELSLHWFDLLSSLQLWKHVTEMLLLHWLKFTSCWMITNH